jgi:hypothetical protein
MVTAKRINEAVLSSAKENTFMHNHSENARILNPWSVDRWGRLIAGTSVLAFTVMGLVHHRFWLIGTLVCAVSLIITSITDECVVHDALIKFGAREREDLFLPGGIPIGSYDAKNHQDDLTGGAPIFRHAKYEMAGVVILSALAVVQHPAWFVGVFLGLFHIAMPLIEGIAQDLSEQLLIKSLGIRPSTASVERVFQTKEQHQLV